jgi:hypothetical protein
VSGIALAASVGAASWNLSSDDRSLVAAAYAANKTLAASTFTVRATMRMRHFPWLRFHLSGTGQFVRGERYEVSFTRVPFFAKAFSHVDLSSLSPRMWRNRYVVRLRGYDGSNAVYALRDPADTSLRVALVTVNRDSGISQVDLQYTNGSDVQLAVSTNRTDGYLVPAKIYGTVNTPLESLDVAATFGDYAFRESTAMLNSR